MSTPDREKALELALAQIEKNHGKGSVMRLGDDTRPPVGIIPTGSIALDVALGVGGLPRGRVVEIYGPESSGKCLTADTYVWSDHGLETVGELFARCGEPASCTSRTTDVSGQGVRMVNERGELESLAAITHNNRKPTLRITARSGRSLTLTHNHPLRVMSERGFIVWRKAGDIAVGDTLVSAAFGAVEAAAADGLNEDEAVLLGYLVAEGTLSERYQVAFTNWDPEVGAEFTALARHVFDAEVRCYYGKEYHVPGKRVRDMAYERYGLDYVTAAGKTVPHCVRTAGNKAQRAFLSALFEGDGWIDKSSTVGLGTASEQLARQVQLLLYGLGVPATVSSTYNKTYERDYWNVTINPATAGQFLEQVGFRSERRRAQVLANFQPSKLDAQLTNIPHIAGLIRDLRDDSGGDRAFDRIAGDLFRTDLELACSRNRLVKLIDWCDERADRLPSTSTVILAHLRTLVAHRYTYEAVVSIDDAGLQPTFDVMLPDTHSFLANGVLSHNTTVALHAVANAQAAGGIVAFIDAEHALDPEYAKALGVDTDNLLVSQPDTGEQALEIADMLIRSGALDLIVVDSVAALVPRAEIEGEMGDSHVGLQARLMSQALRKITGALSNSGTTMIFINQLREKIGVMFGCLSYGTRVTLADGSQEKIGKIVNQRLPVEVLSYDPDAGRMVPRKVVNWFDNGPTEQFLQITVARPGGNGRAQMGLTANHLVHTPGGWREAGELSVGDRVLLSQSYRLGPQQWQALLGGLMGDANLSPSRMRGSLGTRFRMGHGAKQVEYLDWKASLFGNVGQSRRVNAKGAAFVDLTPLPELAELREAVYLGDGHKHLSWEYLKALTPLALAVWYCDDGSFQSRAKGLQKRTKDGSGRSEICVQSLSPGSRERLVEHLADTFDLHPKLALRGARKMPVLSFAKDETAKLHELIAPYVHSSLEYKLLERFRGRFSVEPEFVPPTSLPMPAPVIDVRVKPRTQSMHRFDIEVEGTHNYLADGVVVHNSPETTTGGKALKFYASVRLDIRRIETLKDGADMVGNRTRVKVVKNKVAPPFKQAEFDILYGVGISREGSLVDVGVEQGIVRKSGAWYTYEGDQMGQGKENARKFLKENPDVGAEIEKRIKEKLGIGAVLDADPALPAPVDF
ncbi:MAG: intein-containing recombinase RecA [Pseudonocardia sp.]|nr:intein-containing recombinase RecA [Pseudonocardia sp.]